MLLATRDTRRPEQIHAMAPACLKFPFRRGRQQDLVLPNSGGCMAQTTVPTGTTMSPARVQHNSPARQTANK